MCAQQDSREFNSGDIPQALSSSSEEELSSNLKDVLLKEQQLRNAAERLVTATDQEELFDVLNESLDPFFPEPEPQFYLQNQSNFQIEPVEDYETEYLELLQEQNPDLIGDLHEREEVAIISADEEWPISASEMICAPFVDREGVFLGLLILPIQNNDLSPHLLNQMNFLSNQTTAALFNFQLLDTIQEKMDEIQQQEHMLRNIIESINSGILVLDPSGKIIHYNRNAATMMNIEGSKLMNETIDRLPESELVDGIQDVVEQTRKQGFAMEQRVEQELAEGTVIPIAIGCAKLRDQNMNDQGIIVTLRDMTASKEMKRLQKLDEMKDEFVANVTHELRTPLTSIKAYTESLQDMVQDNETAVDFLEVIDEESNRLMDLIEDLLSLSKITEESLELDREEFSLKELLEDLQERKDMVSDDHVISLDYFPEHTEIYADYDLTYEVFENLLSNAIKYSPDGGEIFIHVIKDGAYIHTSIVDEGIGLSEEEKDKIFDQFYRASKANEQQIQGTGLGLAITKNIVNAHGGKIEVESEEGDGSTFTVSLPISD